MQGFLGLRYAFHEEVEKHERQQHRAREREQSFSLRGSSPRAVRQEIERHGPCAGTSGNGRALKFALAIMYLPPLQGRVERQLSIKLAVVAPHDVFSPHN